MLLNKIIIIIKIINKIIALLEFGFFRFINLVLAIIILLFRSDHSDYVMGD